MNIKTLAEILAESDADSASAPTSKPKKTSKTSQTSKALRSPHAARVDKKTSQKSASTAKRKRREKRFHPAARFSPEPNDTPAYQPPKAQSIKEMLAEVKHHIHGHSDDSAPTITADSDARLEGVDHLESTEGSAPLLGPKAAHSHSTDAQADNLPAALKAYLRTPEQRQAEIDAIKAESRLRWLAFYYLSRREYGKAELKQKLLDKEQDPDKIDALLDEFEEKGYQSDYRTTLMLIRENIRKGRGRGRIKQAFYQKKIAMPDNIDELIDMANAESEEFSEFVEDSDDNLVEGVDWLKLAVTARTKKYGSTLPHEPKDKARQLRFLQYRGFKSDICFAALDYTLETLDERF
ncbi:regulatory protein RecX [Psychrobacter celer]|uniref:regulatory protein RecX n=1 Tax=Psychrobacter TaxID=497 RepID=UPI000ED498ED|nr:MULTISPECIES: regulatory protein RecX [Psychrobacter]HCH27228.1 inhibitor/regulator of recA, recX [Psychrobacter sp.]